ncbi:hypothetical protein SARC_08784 [Sphaeroforma arctica JP610]|uniref:Uncharacterized protein n=1 Tax=Sphaeroforma arctica JP610 TaxID=667725 RepID=A0A0L0FQ00_9EUKA|nr:hypothetical protein SARC_08784 [Sphaeroforma arctica JP610]KNC78794.1 hypothetical protein SARC_08784 [Sphaeroforma arctica JP610]|eukprot:XP_014152696.1 hypothetical protein SARC_08784 [Sphaeroforma arctica JP610]
MVRHIQASDYIEPNFRKKCHEKAKANRFKTRRTPSTFQSPEEVHRETTAPILLFVPARKVTNLPKNLVVEQSSPRPEPVIGASVVQGECSDGFL